MAARGSRELLFEAAKHVFAEKGLEGATVKDIADKANVNISLVSYYFNGKEGLYRECLEAFGGSHAATAERVLKPPRTRDEFKARMQIFAEEFISLHLKEPDICKILHRDFESPNTTTLEVFKNSFVPIFQQLMHFISVAKKNHVLRPDLDPGIAAAMIFGSLVHLIRMDKIRRDLFGESLLDSKHFEATISQCILFMTESVFAEKK